MRQQIWNLSQENLVLGKLDYKIRNLQMSWYTRPAILSQIFISNTPCH
jgi:hypothetical protein